MLLTLNNYQDLFLQLHRGIGKSSVFINYAVWESLKHSKQAINKILLSPDSQSPLLKYDDDSLIIFPTFIQKVAVPGICVD
jgi:hypothetical protein